MNKMRELQLQAVLTREANTFLLSFVFGVVCLGRCCGEPYHKYISFLIESRIRIDLIVNIC